MLFSSFFYCSISVKNFLQFHALLVLWPLRMYVHSFGPHLRLLLLSATKCEYQCHRRAFHAAVSRVICCLSFYGDDRDFVLCMSLCVLSRRLVRISTLNVKRTASHPNDMCCRHNTMQAPRPFSPLALNFDFLFVAYAHTPGCAIASFPEDCWQNLQSHLEKNVAPSRTQDSGLAFRAYRCCPWLTVFPLFITRDRISQA